MGLIIEQGIHEEELPITSDLETAQITGLRAVKEDVRKNSFYLDMIIISDGKYKGRKLSDLIAYDPADPMAFKYMQLRRAAKSPYNKAEGNKIDIEKLLLKRAVGVKLSVREHNGNDYQNIGYVALESTPTIKPLTNQKDKIEAVESETSSDELPETFQETSAPDTAPEKPKDISPAPELTDDDFPF